jgi:hypothetical protein
VVVRAPPTGSLTSCNPQPSESDVVHDRIRLRQHQIIAIACIGFAISTWHVIHAGAAEGRETVSGSSCSCEFSPGGCAAEMISDGCTDANGKVLVECVGENLLPTAQTWRPRPGSTVAAPGTRNRHTDLLCHRRPGQALVAQLQDLLCGSRMSGRAAATYGDAGTAKLMAHCRRRNAQLGTDLPQGPALGVQVSCTLNVHRATVTSRSAASGSFGLRRSPGDACNEASGRRSVI